MFACAYCEHPLICDSCQTDYLPPSPAALRSAFAWRGRDHLPRHASRIARLPLVQDTLRRRDGRCLSRLVRFREGKAPSEPIPVPSEPRPGLVKSGAAPRISLAHGVRFVARAACVAALKGPDRIAQGNALCIDDELYESALKGRDRTVGPHQGTAGGGSARSPGLVPGRCPRRSPQLFPKISKIAIMDKYNGSLKNWGGIY